MVRGGGEHARLFHLPLRDIDEQLDVLGRRARPCRHARPLVAPLEQLLDRPYVALLVDESFDRVDAAGVVVELMEQVVVLEADVGREDRETAVLGAIAQGRVGDELRQVVMHRRRCDGFRFKRDRRQLTVEVVVDTLRVDSGSNDHAGSDSFSFQFRSSPLYYSLLSSMQLKGNSGLVTI